MKRFAAVITFALALALDPGTGWAQPLATSVAWDDASWAARPEGLIGSLTVPARADRPSFRLSRAEVFATGVLVVAPASILTGLAGAALENTFTECDYCEFHGAAGFILGWGLGAAVVGAPLIHAANKGRGDLHYGMISAALVVAGLALIEPFSLFIAPLTGTIAAAIAESETTR